MRESGVIPSEICIRLFLMTHFRLPSFCPRTREDNYSDHKSTLRAIAGYGAIPNTYAMWCCSLTLNLVT